MEVVQKTFIHEDIDTETLIDWFKKTYTAIHVDDIWSDYVYGWEVNYEPPVAEVVTEKERFRLYVDEYYTMITRDIKRSHFFLDVLHHDSEECIFGELGAEEFFPWLFREVPLTDAKPILN